MRRAAKRQSASRPEVRGAAADRAVRATVGLLLAVALGVLVAGLWPRLFAPSKGAMQPASVGPAAAGSLAPVPTVAAAPSPAASAASPASPTTPATARVPAAAATPPTAAAAPPAVAATPPQPAFSFTSRDGEITFTVPQPGDPEYADYQQMLQHPHFRSSLEGLPGYALPYDPEWRSVVTGKRQVGTTPLELEGGAISLEALASAYLQAIAARDEVALLRLRVSREEWEGILWPEFPQSRPYVRAKPEDAWMLHHATSMSGAQKALESLGGHTLELVEVTHGETAAYTNFTLVQGVVIRARDQQTQKFVDIPYLPAVVGRNGRFKAYIYEG